MSVQDSPEQSGDELSEEQRNQQWANIFSAFGEAGIREVLHDTLRGLASTQDDHRVVEIIPQGGDDYSALDITEHHDTLQEAYDEDEN